jgi:hypothetical protein
VLNPTYVFDRPDDQEKFQSDVRERDLQGTFEAVCITTRTRRNPSITNITAAFKNETKLTYGEFVKIWTPRDNSKGSSFTFWVNNKDSTNSRHFEYDILWFELTIDSNRGKIATLHLKADAILPDDMHESRFDMMDIKFLKREGECLGYLSLSANLPSKTLTSIKNETTSFISWATPETLMS